jgi:Cu/Ag efflux protein CusF
MASDDGLLRKSAVDQSTATQSLMPSSYASAILKAMIRTFVFALAIFLVACGSKPPEAKRYPMEGEVKALDAQSKTATIAAGKIGDWMEAMTMEYPVKPDAEFQKLHIGDHIQATVVVQDPNYYVTDIKVAK